VSGRGGQRGPWCRVALAPVAGCLLIVAFSWSLAAPVGRGARAVGPDDGPASPARVPASRPASRRSPARRWGFSERQKREVLAFTKEHMPEQHKRLVRLLEDDPRRAGWLLRRLYRLYVNVRRYPPEVRRAAIARHQVRVAIYQAVRELRQADSESQRRAIKARLAELLGQQFDHEQVVRDYEVKRLAEQVADLAAEVRRRRANRAAVIEARLKRLLAARPRPASQPAATQRARPASRPAAGWSRHVARGRMRRRLSSEQAGEVFEYIRKHVPELHDRLLKLRQRDPGRMMVVLEHLRGLVRRLRAMPAEVRNAAITSHRLNVAIFSKAREARQAKEPAKRKRLVAELRELLGKQFQADQVVKEYQAQRLRKQLADLRAELEARKRERGKIIAERLERLSRPLAAAPPARPGPRR